MLNRFVAVVRSLYEGLRQAVWRLLPRRLDAFVWNRIAERLNRRLEKFAEQRSPPRTRQTGVLRAVLGVLARGPCAVEEIMAGVSVAAISDLTVAIVDRAPIPAPYTRARVLAALRYAARCGYVELGPACGEWKVARWSITEAGLARLKVKAKPPVLAPKPGEWFPARLGVPRPPELVNAEQPPGSPEAGQEGGK